MRFELSSSELLALDHICESILAARKRGFQHVSLSLDNEFFMQQVESLAHKNMRQGARTASRGPSNGSVK